MIIITKPYNDSKPVSTKRRYAVSIGINKYFVIAESEAQAVEIIASKFGPEWYFDGLEVELMAKSARKNVEEFAAAEGLYYCRKYDIYFPELKIEEA